MQMGSAAVAMAVAMMVMLGTVPCGAGSVSCLNSALAPEADATTVLFQLQNIPGQCCHTNNNSFCTILLEIGGAAASVCGSQGYCPNCADVATALNKVMAHCVDNAAVDGTYSPDSNSAELYYITSSSSPP